MRVYRVVEVAEVKFILETLLAFANNDIDFDPDDLSEYEKKWNALIDSAKKLLEDLNG